MSRLPMRDSLGSLPLLTMAENPPRQLLLAMVTNRTSRDTDFVFRHYGVDEAVLAVNVVDHAVERRNAVERA